MTGLETDDRPIVKNCSCDLESNAEEGALVMNRLAAVAHIASHWTRSFEIEAPMRPQT